MNRRIRVILLSVLLLSFLSGCSLFQRNGAGQGEQFSESVRKLREKYSKNTPYDVQDKVIHIKENESIAFPTEVGKMNDFETLPHEGQTELLSSFELYGDSNLQGLLGADFKLNEDREVEIEPAYHFSATRVEANKDRTEYGLAKQGESWGVFDTLYLLQRDDEHTGKKLKKPKLWVVKIDKKGRDKLALRANSSLLSDGRLQLEWTDVPGADSYSIVKREYVTLPGSDSNTGLYNYKEVDRVTSTVYRTDLPTTYDTRNGGRSGDDPVMERQRLLQAFDQDYSSRKAEQKPYDLFVVPLKGQEALGSISNPISSDSFAKLMPSQIDFRTFSDQISALRQQGNIPAEAPLQMMDGQIQNFPIVYEKLEKSGRDVRCLVSIKGMPTVKTDFIVQQASVEEVQSAADQHNEAANKAESRSGAYDKYISVEQADLDLNGKTVVRDVSSIEDKVTAKSAAEEYFAKALLSDAEYVDYSEFPELSEGDVSEIIIEVLEQNPTAQQGVLPYIDGKQHVVHFKYDAKEAAKYEKARKKVKEIVKEIITDQMSDREKIEAINRYLIDHTSYDHPAYEAGKAYEATIENQNSSEEEISKARKKLDDMESSYNITGPLLEGKGVCNAYAVTFQALAQEAGLETMYVKGNTPDFDRHAWNYAKVDGQWLALDVTWNDTDGDANKKENRYLLLSMDDATYAQSHYANSRFDEAIQNDGE
ncbi:transglutaminase domain-containing protein [Streptococcus panodentis]|uniref:Transglutaminase n=1 Tax=Streptococcus panodentis TaxID=1581472 RepID=A0ABS5ATP4_9STRE|nr:transglutaminase domain-containing protein [Streptococcus panodentis]MBP2619949.1 transglutaminase [Streptococcus panodentis]